MITVRFGAPKGLPNALLFAHGPQFPEAHNRIPREFCRKLTFMKELWNVVPHSWNDSGARICGASFWKADNLTSVFALQLQLSLGWRGLSLWPLRGRGWIVNSTLSAGIPSCRMLKRSLQRRGRMGRKKAGASKKSLDHQQPVQKSWHAEGHAGLLPVVPLYLGNDALVPMRKTHEEMNE